MKISYLQGTPWHYEQLKKTCKEGSKNCLYNYNICVHKTCFYYGKKCVGKGVCEDFESKGSSAKVITEKTYKLTEKNTNTNDTNITNNTTKNTYFHQKERCKMNEQLDLCNMINEEENTSLDDTMDQKFLKLSQDRTNKVKEYLRLISNLSNKNNYTYTDEQVNKMFTYIEEAVQKAKESFYESEFMEDFKW